MQGDAQQPAAMCSYPHCRCQLLTTGPVCELAAQAQPQVPDGCKTEADCQWHPWCKDKCLAAAPPVPAQAAPSMEAPEPVAWMRKGTTPEHGVLHNIYLTKDWLSADNWIPLYAHPTTAAPAGVPSYDCVRELEAIVQGLRSIVDVAREEWKREGTWTDYDEAAHARSVAYNLRKLNADHRP